MNLAESLEAGRRQSPEELDNNLRSLALDERFPAVLGWLDRNREQFVRAASQQSMANKPGALAHCLGSVHAIQLLQAQLSHLVAPEQASGGEEPPAEL